MPSYMNLAVLALAASTVSPALCAPTWESQKQSRAVLEERLGVGADLGLSFLGGVVPAFFEHLLGMHGSNGSTRAIEASDSEARAVAELEERALGNDDLAKRKMGAFSTFLAGTVLSFLGSAVGSVLRRSDVSLEDLLAASSLLGKRDVAPEDVKAILDLFNRAPDELD